VRLQLPPLRDRLEDLDLLCEHFLADLRSKRPEGSITGRTFSPEAIKLMSKYDWPGNIRELRNVVERAVTFCEEDSVGVDDLPTDLQARMGRPTNHGVLVQADVDPGTGLKEAKESMVARFERDYLKGLLERHNLNISRVAREAGIDRRHVYRLMKKYGIDLPDR
jgi:DNA-binding NtrC family response regulator